MNKKTETRRCHPWLAVVLSLLSTGLGHIYCGKWRLGGTLFIISMSTFPIALIAAMCHPADLVLSVLTASVAVVAGLYLYAVVDAFRIARAESRSTGPASCSWHESRWNNLGLYLVLVALGLGAPATGAMLVRAHVYEAFKTAGASMEPNLRQGDHFLINKLDFEIEGGDVVVFQAPHREPGIQYVRRVIALSGDRVGISDGRVFVNGESISESSSSDGVVRELIDGVAYSVRYETAMETDFEEQVVPEGQCFVLGDNRSRTQDSRVFSFIDLHSIIGEVQYIYLSSSEASRFGAFQN